MKKYITLTFLLISMSFIVSNCSDKEYIVNDIQFSVEKTEFKELPGRSTLSIYARKDSAAKYINNDLKVESINASIGLLHLINKNRGTDTIIYHLSLYNYGGDHTMFPTPPSPLHDSSYIKFKDG